MSTTDLFKVQSEILEELRNKKTQIGVFWIIPKSLYKHLDIIDCQVFEFFLEEKILRLATEIDGTVSQEEIIKNPIIRPIDDSTIATLQKEHKNKYLESDVTVFEVPLCSDNKCLGLVRIRSKIALSEHEERVVQTICDFAVFVIERNIERESLISTQKKLEGIISESTSNLDMALEKLTDQFAELKLYKDKADILLNETYHRVNNNLQIILSIVRLYDSYNDHKIPELTEIANRVRILSSIHLNIMNSVANEKLHLGNFLTDILNQLTYFYDGINCRIDNQSTIFGLSFDRSLPLGLLLHEIIIYLAKHPDYNLKSTKCIVSNSDLPNEIEISIQSNDDFKIDTSDASQNIHLTLIEALIEQLDGQQIPGKSKEHICLKFHI